MTPPFEAPVIRGENTEFELSQFGDEEVVYVNKTIGGLGAKDLLANLRNGDICLGLKQNGTIAAYTFITKKPLVFRKQHFNLNKDEAYLHSMYTFEAFRGKNLAPYLRYKCYEYLRNEGFNKFYSISEYFNKSTIKFKKKLNS
ncbi:MAG: GNAT family N-acetyltransferase, partial [Myxococcota bacterium]